MTHGRVAKALATASLAGLAVLGMTASAVAQPYSGPGREERPPGQGFAVGCPADPARPGPGRCGRGAEASASSGRGTFDPGSQGRFALERPDGRQLGTFANAMRVTPDGAANVTFTVPPFLADGTYSLVFLGERDGFSIFVRVPFTVSGGDGVLRSSDSSGDFIAAGAPGSTSVGSIAPGAAPAAAAPAAAAPAAPAAGTAPSAAVSGTLDGALSVELSAPSGTAATTQSGGSAAEPTTVASGRALPRTGSDSIVELTAAGIALVALGAGVVVVVRRRRDETGTLAA